MKLYHLYPKDNLTEDNPWNPWFDKAFGFVIRAESEEEAREIANANGGDETGPVTYFCYRHGGNPWLDPNYSECVELTEQGEKGVIIRDFQGA